MYPVYTGDRGGEYEGKSCSEHNTYFDKIKGLIRNTIPPGTRHIYLDDQLRRRYNPDAFLGSSIGRAIGC